MLLDYKLKTFLEKFEDQIYIDPSFQRRKSWGSKQKNEFLSALTQEHAPHGITMGDVEECLRYSKSKACLTSQQYYESVLADGYKFVSLDGQNRAGTIIDFLNNEFTISGVFLDIDDQEVKITNKYFKDLPQRLQDRFFHGCSVYVKTYESKLRPQLSKIFHGINSGVPLNSHEKSQCMMTQIADWVRDTSSKHSKMLKVLVDQKAIARLGDDELVAKAAMVLMPHKGKPWGLSASKINNWYEMGTDLVSNPDPYPDDKLKRVEAILNIVNTVILNQDDYHPSNIKTKVMPRSLMWAVILSCEWVYDNDLQIQNAGVFFKKLRDIDDKMNSDSHIQYGRDRNALVSKGKSADEISIEDYYHRWRDLPHQVSARRKRTAALIEEVKNNQKSLTIGEKLGIMKSVKSNKAA